MTSFSPGGSGADTPIGDLSDGSPDLVVAGERLNGDLLRRFYALRGYEPVWASRPEQARALANAVLQAGEHGMNPELFHGGLLWRREAFPARRRELLLTHAVLTYADALVHGAVPIGRRRDNEALAPEPVDVAAALDSALRRRDPVAAIEALAPDTPSYRTLREALRAMRASPPRPSDRAAVGRLRQIEVNLERQRWLPRQLPADRVWVNVADQGLVLYRGGRPVFSTRVVVGEEVERSQSPEFQAVIQASYLNPPWIIPADIVSAELLPKLARDPEYLTRNNMILRANGEVEQLPGPNAGLGLIMFDMPNRFDVYLHDTPERVIFNRDNRRLSHGCIRVQNPLEFAAMLMDRPAEAIQEQIATSDTIRVTLPRPVPVFVVYQTAFADTEGRLQFRPDFYDRDGTIWQMLQRRAPAPSLSV